MKTKFRCEFAKNSFNQGSRKDILVFNNIQDINKYCFSEKGRVNYTKGFKKLGDLEDGDIIEFEAEVKEIVFANPTNIKRFDRKSIERSVSAVENFFDINV